MLAAIAFLIVGLVLLVYSADFLVKGAANLAAAMGVSPLVVGLTVVAFGTSAPELAVSVMSAFKGQADIAVGNVVGSNIFNVLFILGISALIIPLVVHAQLVRFDVPVMIGVSVLLYFLAMDGLISRVDGIVLFVLLLVYVIFLLRLSKKEKDAGVLSEYEEEYGKPAADPQYLKNILFVLGGVAGLVIGSDRLVYGAVFIAKSFGEGHRGGQRGRQQHFQHSHRAGNLVDRSTCRCGCGEGGAGVRCSGHDRSGSRVFSGVFRWIQDRPG
jgi:cation:H+ antiporter